MNKFSNHQATLKGRALLLAFLFLQQLCQSYSSLFFYVRCNGMLCIEIKTRQSPLISPRKSSRKCWWINFRKKLIWASFQISVLPFLSTSGDHQEKDTSVTQLSPCKEQKIRNMRNKLPCSPLIFTLSYAVKHSTSPITSMVPCLSISRCWWAHLKPFSWYFSICKAYNSYCCPNHNEKTTLAVTLWWGFCALVLLFCVEQFG